MNLGGQEEFLRRAEKILLEYIREHEENPGEGVKSHKVIDGFARNDEEKTLLFLGYILGWGEAICNHPNKEKEYVEGVDYIG